jgi:hypothetical protein
MKLTTTEYIFVGLYRILLEFGKNAGKAGNFSIASLMRLLRPFY